MRTPDEMQRAHDILHAIVTGEVEINAPREFRLMCYAAHDALSWVFGWPCGEAFAVNLDTIRREFKRCGIIEERIQ